MDLNNTGNMTSPQVNPFAYPSEVCEECGNYVFQPGLIFKVVPGILLGQGTESVPVPVKVACCSKCGALSPLDRKMLEEEERTAKQAEEKKSSLII